MKNLHIYVAAHKEIIKYAKDDCYEVIHVGAANHTETFGYLCDNTGDNISEKNPLYCELTGLYWIWKNEEPSEYIGLCHYRRYPAKHSFAFSPEKEILKAEEIMEMMSDCDILLPMKLKKTQKNSLCTDESDLQRCRPYMHIKKSMQKICPEYEKDLKDVFMQPEMCFGNIFVLPWGGFCEYCEWLFKLLFDIEQELSGINDERPRDYGFFSEWMLNVWVQHNNLKVKYVPIICTEEKHDIRFFLKLIKERVTANK